MDAFKKGWFTEESPMWPGIAQSLKVNKVILDKKTKYQHLQIFESSTWGRVLVLDGAIQVTEKDECSYQEMMSFMALNSHPNPRKVLVIGGGDGGVVREVAKHPSVTKIVQCEIDGEVIEACKEHLPSLAVGYEDPRLEQHIGDGFQFLKENTEKYDVIITDASDPVVANDDGETKDGPAESLFRDEYYKLLHSCLSEEGVLASQGESLWLHQEIIGRLIRKSKSIYPVVDYATIYTPSYPSGQIGVLLCGKSQKTSFRKPLSVNLERLEGLNLSYYSPAIHQAAFAAPAMFARFLESI